MYITLQWQNLAIVVFTVMEDFHKFMQICELITKLSFQNLQGFIGAVKFDYFGSIMAVGSVNPYFLWICSLSVFTTLFSTVQGSQKRPFCVIYSWILGFSDFGKKVIEKKHHLCQTNNNFLKPQTFRLAVHLHPWCIKLHFAHSWSQLAGPTGPSQNISDFWEELRFLIKSHRLVGQTPMYLVSLMMRGLYFQMCFISKHTQGLFKR